MAERGKRHEIGISPSVSGRLERTGCHFFLSLFLFLLDRKAKSEGNYFMPLPSPPPPVWLSTRRQTNKSGKDKRQGSAVNNFSKKNGRFFFSKAEVGTFFVFIVFLRSTIDEPSGGRNFARLGRLAETNNKSETKDKWWPTRSKKRHRCE